MTSSVGSRTSSVAGRRSSVDPGNAPAAALTADLMQRALRAHASEARAAVSRTFFKTGPGQYGEGDVFIGVTAPDMRAVSRASRAAPLDELQRLLRSPVHEDRLLALVILTERFTKADAATQRRIYDLYLTHTEFINNWDLVDLSAGHIVGGWLADRSRTPLTRLAKSRSLWERRIAIIATFSCIRRGELDETFRVADLLLSDPHDLIHKAVGWMLREAEKRDPAAARRFLRDRHARMPRTMLRYAIERFPEAERQTYLRAASRRPGGRRDGKWHMVNAPEQRPPSRR